MLVMVTKPKTPGVKTEMYCRDGNGVWCKHSGQLTQSICLLATAGMCLLLLGCTDDRSTTEAETGVDVGGARASTHPEYLLPEYWQNPEGLELELVTDNTELRVGESLTICEVLTNVSEEGRCLKLTGWVRHAQELSVWHGNKNPLWSRRDNLSMPRLYSEPTEEGFVFLREPVDITNSLMGSYPWSVPLISQNRSSSGHRLLLTANESLTDNEETFRVQIPGQYLIRAQWSGYLYDRPEVGSASGKHFDVTSHWVLLTVTPASTR